MYVPSPRISSLSPLLLIGSHLKKCVFPALMCWTVGWTWLKSTWTIEGYCFVLCLTFWFAINSFNGSPQLGHLSSGPRSQQNLSIYSFCVRRSGSGCLGSSGEVGSLLRRSSRLVITSNISVGTGSSWSLCRPLGMWCDAALSRTVRKIFSYLLQYVGRERLLGAASTSCLYLSQLSFFRLT